jgi:hypothetical protein
MIPLGIKRRMIIAVPAWGDYVKVFLGPVLRSHRAAIGRLRQETGETVDIRYVVMTDAPAAVSRALAGYPLTLIPLPLTSGLVFQTLCDGHREGIEAAREGDRVVLLNADIIVSTGAFAAVERAFRQGKKAVVCGGTRTLLRPWDRYPPPLPARDLAWWAYQHAHPITKLFFWGTGTTSHPCTVYFRKGPNVVLRGFHIHPLAIIKDRDLPFSGSIDLNLMENYSFDETHVVTDVDELAIAEVSAKWKKHDDAGVPFDTATIVEWAVRGARSTHWWNFRHRVIIAGNPEADVGDTAVADEVLRLCPYTAALEAAL